MKRTTIFVPDDLERDLRLYASRDKRPAASLVREALAEYVARRQGAERLPAFAGRFASGRNDTAERHEELLFRQLTPHGAPAPSGASSRRPAGKTTPHTVPRKRR